MIEAILDYACLELPRTSVRDLRLRPVADDAAQRLRHALGKGLGVEPDLRRPGFYEAEIDGFRYYFHVVPGRDPARVLLLARWPESEN